MTHYGENLRLERVISQMLSGLRVFGEAAAAQVGTSDANGNVVKVLDPIRQRRHLSPILK
jgi:hypothetical protein